MKYSQKQIITLAIILVIIALSFFILSKTIKGEKVDLLAAVARVVKSPTHYIYTKSNNTNTTASKGNNSDQITPCNNYVVDNAWGGSGAQQFNFPSSSINDIAVDNSGNVYIVDTIKNRIEKFTSTGSFIAMFGWGVATGANQFQICTNESSCHSGIAGSGNGQFDTPFEVSVDSNGYIYIADSHNHRVQEFDSSFGFIDKWGSFGSGNSQYKNVQSIKVNSMMGVYTAEANGSSTQHRIQRHDIDGTFLSKWGHLGTGNGEFNHPTGIGLDSSVSTGYVYVADGHNNRIQKFTENGTYLDQWSFNLPESIDVDQSGNVFVVGGPDKVVKYNSNGNILTQFQINNNPVYGFSYSGIGIGVDSVGNVYVLYNSWDNLSLSGFHKIQKFKPSCPCTPPTSLVGDVNNDGNINTMDAQAIINMFTNVLQKHPPFCSKDVNDDGSINSIDALMILKYFNGLPDTGFVGQCCSDT